MRRAVVDQAGGVDGEHRGVDGAGHAHLHGDVADNLVVGRVAGGERRQELMLAGVPHRSRGVVLPREALRERDVGKRLAVGRLDGRGRLVLGRRLGDGELELAVLPTVIAHADNNRNGFARLIVIAILDSIILATDKIARCDFRTYRSPCIFQSTVRYNNPERWRSDSFNDVKRNFDISYFVIVRNILRSKSDQLRALPNITNFVHFIALPRVPLRQTNIF